MLTVTRRRVPRAEAERDVEELGTRGQGVGDRELIPSRPPCILSPLIQLLVAGRARATKPASSYLTFVRRCRGVASIAPVRTFTTEGQHSVVNSILAAASIADGVLRGRWRLQAHEPARPGTQCEKGIARRGTRDAVNQLEQTARDSQQF